MVKRVVQQLISTKNSRIVLVDNEGTSKVWMCFQLIKVHDELMELVLRKGCETVLKCAKEIS